MPGARTVMRVDLGPKGCHLVLGKTNGVRVGVSVPVMCWDHTLICVHHSQIE